MAIMQFSFVKRLKAMLYLIVGLGLSATILAGSASATPETDCFDLVQGNIAWNYTGTTTWAPANIQNLCQGTSVATEPAYCFDQVMHGGINWGGGTTWEWENALNLCKGSNNAAATISCFQGHLAGGMAWQQAIDQCQPGMILIAATPAETACYNFVQGNIPWDYGGSTTWAPVNIQNLCQGTTVAAEPGRCFDHVMHGGVNWGGGTNWEWQNALDLCHGTNNADATVACFQGQVASGVPWQQAIDQCQPGGAPPGGPTIAETACHDFIQGNIPWNYDGATTWAPVNLDNLCQGTTVAAEPGRCFDRAMHGGVNWGGGTNWQWQNALDLCQGTSNADATVACFQGQVAGGTPWPQAVIACKS